MAVLDWGKIALLGSDGMLGRCWLRALRDSGADPMAPTLPDSDLRDPANPARIIGPETRLVVNCAAYTNVDGAEDEPALAEEINGYAVGRLATRCREVGAVLVHYSTDYVFHGEHVGPYPVGHPIDPINAYGRSKALGERLIAESGCEALVLRTSWLYAPHGKNFVLTIVNLVRERGVIRVVDDQVGRPTSCDELVATSSRLLDAGARGILHACDSGQCSWHEFASAIGARVRPACRVEACPSAEFPRPAKRPANSVLDLTGTDRLVGPAPLWRDSVNAVLDAVDEQEKAIRS